MLPPGPRSAATMQTWRRRSDGCRSASPVLTEDGTTSRGRCLKCGRPTAVKPWTLDRKVALMLAGIKWAEGGVLGNPLYHPT